MNPISKHRDFLRSKLINKRGLNIPIQYSENKIEKKPEDLDEDVDEKETTMDRDRDTGIIESEITTPQNQLIKDGVQDETSGNTTNDTDSDEDEDSDQDSDIISDSEEDEEDERKIVSNVETDTSIKINPLDKDKSKTKSIIELEEPIFSSYKSSSNSKTSTINEDIEFGSEVSSVSSSYDESKGTIKDSEKQVSEMEGEPKDNYDMSDKTDKTTSLLGSLPGTNNIEVSVLDSDSNKDDESDDEITTSPERTTKITIDDKDIVNDSDSDGVTSINAVNGVSESEIDKAINIPNETKDDYFTGINKLDKENIDDDGDVGDSDDGDSDDGDVGDSDDGDDDNKDEFDTIVKNIESYYVESQRDLYGPGTSIVFSSEGDSLGEEKDEVTNKQVHMHRYNIKYNSSIDELNKLKKNDRIYLCPYRVVTNSFIPYLQYCLYKYPKSKDPRTNDLMIFSYFKYNDDGLTPAQEASQRINMIFNQLVEESGIIKFNGNYFVFYDLSDLLPKERSDEMTKLRTDNWWWCIIDEIVNFKKILNFPIFLEHVNLFLHNPSMMYLYHIHTLTTSERDNTIPKPLEIPCIGYHGTYYNLKNFILSQGLRPSTIYAMVGPYYYFGTFRKAVRYAGWTSTYDERFVNGQPISDKNGRYKRGTIIRFSIFTGNMTALLNHPTEREDMNKTVIKRIKDNPGEKRREKMIIKMHDHEAVWTEYYDSIYIGKALLANGKPYMKNPEFVIKESYMIDTLSGHEIDQTTLEEKWNNSKEDYNIL
jgi:hypothetical protein